MALLEENEFQGNWLFRYRGYLPVIILVAGASLYIYHILHPGQWMIRSYPWQKAYEMACFLISFMGEVIRSFTVGYTPANTSGRNTKSQVADTLNTKGLYSVVRHPLYLGNFFMWLGVAMLTGSIWFVLCFILIFALYYERIMFAEEQYLRRKFGDLFLAWAEKTPAFFPLFKQYIKPEISFSWRKVLNNEKSSITLLFLIYLFFDLTGEILRKTYHPNYFILGGCIVCITGYIIIKYMKGSRLLHEAGR